MNFTYLNPRYGRGTCHQLQAMPFRLVPTYSWYSDWLFNIQRRTTKLKSPESASHFNTPTAQSQRFLRIYLSKTLSLCFLMSRIHYASRKIQTHSSIHMHILLSKVMRGFAALQNPCVHEKTWRNLKFGVVIQKQCHYQCLLQSQYIFHHQYARWSLCLLRNQRIFQDLYFIQSRRVQGKDMSVVRTCTVLWSQSVLKSQCIFQNWFLPWSWWMPQGQYIVHHQWVPRSLWLLRNQRVFQDLHLLRSRCVYLECLKMLV